MLTISKDGVYQLVGISISWGATVVSSWWGHTQSCWEKFAWRVHCKV